LSVEFDVARQGCQVVRSKVGLADGGQNAGEEDARATPPGCPVSCLDDIGQLSRQSVQAAGRQRMRREVRLQVEPPDLRGEPWIAR